MPRIDLEKWARVSEIGTAIVVVISLVYIAIELDQGNRATQTNSWQAVNEMLVALDTAEATDVKQRAKLSRLGVETASKSFHPIVSLYGIFAGGIWSVLHGHYL